MKFTVEENGIGVSEDARHLLFKPFQKAQAKVRIGGVEGVGWGGRGCEWGLLMAHISRRFHAVGC